MESISLVLLALFVNEAASSLLSVLYSAVCQCSHLTIVSMGVKKLYSREPSPKGKKEVAVPPGSAIAEEFKISDVTKSVTTSYSPEPEIIS